MEQINAKSLARIAAIQLIYKITEYPDDQKLALEIQNMLEFYTQNSSLSSDYELSKSEEVKFRIHKKHFSDLVEYTYKHQEEIDNLIKSKLTSDWTIDNLSKLVLAITRVAVCEIKFFPEVPIKVVINEYTDITSDMASSPEINFVNSIVDNLAKEIRG